MIWWMFLLLGLLLALRPFASEWMRKPMNEVARQNATGDFARLSRGVTHFTWSGPRDGPVLVCVHGLTTPSYVWRGLTAGLVAMGYRVLTYDHYGRGYSDRPAGRQDRRFYVDHLTELLDNQGVTGPITLIGYSMGGPIVSAWAAENPARMRRLVILASAGVIVNAGRTADFMRRTPVLGDWLMYRFFPASHIKGTEADRGLSPEVDEIVELQQGELIYRGFLPAVLSSMRGILASNAEADHQALRQAGIPVLAVWGAEDTLIPVSCKDRLAGWNPDTDQVVIPDAGHSLTFTHPEQMLAALEPLRAEAG